jgi:hypothetical protein
MNDQLLIEKAYQNIYESNSILIPRRSVEERSKNFQIAVQKQVKEYMKNGGVGDLDLRETPITSLPEGLKVGGSLYLDDTPITNLPKGLIVDGYLSLYNTRRITSLPEGLIVGGNLNLINSSITNLPEVLIVGGDLDLYRSNITKLPRELTVGGNLDFDATPLSQKAEYYTEKQLKQMLPNVKGRISK